MVVRGRERGVHASARYSLRYWRYLFDETGDLSRKTLDTNRDAQAVRDAPFDSRSERPQSPDDTGDTARLRRAASGDRIAIQALLRVRAWAIVDVGLTIESIRILLALGCPSPERGTVRTSMSARCSHYVRGCMDAVRASSKSPN